MFMLEREHVKKSATARDAATPFSLSDIEFITIMSLMVNKKISVWELYT